MKIAAVLLAAALASASADGTAARYSTGRFASWVPQSGMPQVAAAALNHARAPVVLYDPQRAHDVPDVLFNFLLLREEYVAVAARQWLQLGLAPASWNRHASRPRVLIDERLLFDYVNVGDQLGPLAFDCLAYDSLGAAERHAFYQWAHLGTASGRSLVLQADRTFTRQDLAWVASDACASYHLAARAKLGINTVLGGAETLVKEPPRPASP